MKSLLRRLVKGLPFRMVLPVVLIMAVVGAGLYFFVLRSVSEFSDRQIRGALTDTSRDLYGLCDSHFSALMRSGRMGNKAAVRIQRARALGAIEDFVKRYRIGCLLVDAGSGEVLLSHAVPEALQGKACSIQEEVPFVKVRCNGDLFYLSHFEFRPWGWHVDLYKDTAEYAPLVHRVHLAYIVTGCLLLLSAVALVWFSDRLLRTPINRMIRAIRSGQAPEYQGSHELEFLSDSIGGMMRSLKTRTDWLERLYTVALIERGGSFFDRIAETVAEAAGLHVLIVQVPDRDRGPRVLAGSSNDEGPPLADPSCLEGLPLETIRESKAPVVLPSGAFEELPSRCLQDLSAEAYLGLPFFDRHGQVIGTIHAFGAARAFDDWDMSFMRTAGQMVAAELELLEKEQEKETYRAQVFRSQKLESLGILAGGVAHDFNNLLMGIQGRASLLMLEAGITRTQMEHARAIEEYVQSATDLTRQLLGFARGGKYDVRPADMNAVLDHSAHLFGRTKKEIRIRKHLQPDLWNVDIDQRQIEQVLLNLFVNAWHAMPGGGDLGLRTENRELNPERAAARDLPPGRYVAVLVADTGVGMDQATMERIFDPFFTTKGMGRGTGLGLASAYGIMQNHGGRIEVQSAIGRGTTFVLFLPASREAVVEDEPGRQAPLRGTETLLLVDDEEMIREVGRRMLESLGYEVLVAENGPEGLSLYRSRGDTIGMVILDMIMPIMGGGKTFRRLKEIDPDVRVLLCSGYSMDGQAREILDQGCMGFIQKPFDTAEISRQVRAVLDAA